MRIITFLILLITPFNLSSQEIKRVDADRSIINYTGKHFLHKWSAENTNISGLVQLDDLSISNIGIVAKVSDFKSGNSNLDSNSLRVIEALKFPNIIFKSTSIIKENGQTIIEGKIEFHGVEKEIYVLAEVIELEGYTKLTGEFNLNLTDYLIDRPSLLLRKIDDAISIKFDIFF